MKKSMREKNKLSVFISLVLRHKPESANVEVDHEGYVNVEDLIKGINETGRTIDKKILEEIVAEDSKGRYSFSEDGTMIRANQGHSIEVDVSLRKANPPETLYHGTSMCSLSSILSDGIKKMSRQYVHLSYDKDIAEQVGSRHGRPIVLEIDAKKMVEDGYEFLISENNVWQIDYIPSEYIKGKENFIYTIHANNPQAVIDRLMELQKKQQKR